MITNNGKIQIKRYLGGQTPSIAQAISFGIGYNGAVATDSSLHFEVERAPLELVAYDFATDKIIYKTSVPTQFQGIITEIGLVSGSVISNSRIISSFDSSLEFWSGTSVTYRSANARIGLDSLSVAAAANASSTAKAANLMLNLSTMANSDIFKFAFWNSAASSVTFRFMTDSSNFYSYTISGLSNGYQIVSRTKDQSTATGSPNWLNINSIEITVQSGSGASTVDFDGIRVEDLNSNIDASTLIAREVLATPFVKSNNSVQDVEFGLKVNI